MTVLMKAITPALPAIADYFFTPSAALPLHLCDQDCTYCCGPETD